MVDAFRSGDQHAPDEGDGRDLGLDQFEAVTDEPGISLDQLSQAYAQLLGQGDDPYEPPAQPCESVAEAIVDQTQAAGQDDGCLGCHRPHAAGEPHLLQASVSKTCLGCHDGARPKFAEKHLGFPAEGMNCGECHDPHSSATAGMLLPETHAPFAGGDCTTCHPGPRPKQEGAR